MNAQLEAMLLKKKVQSKKRWETARQLVWRGLMLFVCGLFIHSALKSGSAPTLAQYVLCLVFTLVAICVVCDWVLERFPPEMDK